MYLTNETASILQLLKSNEALADTHIIKAYPYVNKPTRLKKPVLCVAPGGMEADHIAIGQKQYLGSYSIIVSVFVPHSLGSPVADKTLEAVIQSLSTTGFHRLQVSDIRTADAIDCFTATCKASYRSQILFSEDNIWTQPL